MWEIEGGGYGLGRGLGGGGGGGRGGTQSMFAGSFTHYECSHLDETKLYRLRLTFSPKYINRG